jgi:uncharacterized protein YbcI
MSPYDSEETLEVGSDAAAISNMVVGVLRDHTGRGPTKARTYIADNLITCVLGDSLTKGEQNLVKNGQEQQVLQLRHTFQENMRADLTAGVHDLIDRRVIAFCSANHIDPDLAVETFVLEPVAAAGND